MSVSEKIPYQEEPLLDQEQLDMLLDVAGDMASEFLGETLELFRSEGAPAMAELQVACGEKEWEQIRRHVHYLAGSAANIGLHRLHKFCRAAESCIKTSDLLDSEIDELYAIIESLYGESLQAYQEVVDNPS